MPTSADQPRPDQLPEHPPVGHNPARLPADVRRAAVLAGHRGDVPTARALLDHGDQDVRAAALGALARAGALTAAELGATLHDPDWQVRRRAAELAARYADVQLEGALTDPDPRVVEMAAWAAGERPGPGAAVTASLVGIATGHDDPLCREAAVAALGALGQPEGLAAVLQALGDKPAVRRRAVLALASYDGPAVRTALERALRDRDWQVRQAAEDLLGIAGADGDTPANGDAAGGRDEVTDCPQGEGSKESDR